MKYEDAFEIVDGKRQYTLRKVEVETRRRTKCPTCEHNTGPLVTERKVFPVRAVVLGSTIGNHVVIDVGYDISALEITHATVDGSFSDQLGGGIDTSDLVVRVPLEHCTRIA